MRLFAEYIYRLALVNAAEEARYQRRVCRGRIRVSEGTVDLIPLRDGPIAASEILVIFSNYARPAGSRRCCCASLRARTGVHPALRIRAGAR